MRPVVPFGFRAASLAVALTLADCAMASIFGTIFAGSPPATLGARDGRLSPCPDRPNCVSSAASDPAQRIAPLAFSGDPAAAMDALAVIVRAMPRSTVIVARVDYLHVEFASATMGFVDDAEFAPVASAGIIAVRSAARLGYGDFGVNRERVETIRAAFSNRRP